MLLFTVTLRKLNNFCKMGLFPHTAMLMQYVRKMVVNVRLVRIVTMYPLCTVNVNVC
jgi:hypothetical protein